MAQDPEPWLTQRWQKGDRYYVAEVVQDLFGTWLVKRSWGSIHTTEATTARWWTTTINTSSNFIKPSRNAARRKDTNMPDYRYDPSGNRKYLTEAEKTTFRKAAEDEQRENSTLCLLLHYSGCRISEALAINAACVDLSNQTITFESLKKRKKGVFRTVPLFPEFVTMLDLVHGLRKLQKKNGGKDMKLWSFSRTIAWRGVKRVMERAGIAGESTAIPLASTPASRAFP